MTDEPLNYHTYYAEVNSLAESILEEAWDANQDEDANREYIEEYLWESIDGHQWVIYTYRAQQVLAISENDDYSLVNFGAESIADESGIKWSSMAFGALYADVSEVLWPLFEEKVSEVEE